MEQETEVEAVFYVETPYATNEEEIATSYIAIQDSESAENEEMDTFVDQGDVDSPQNCDATVGGKNADSFDQENPLTVDEANPHTVDEENPHTTVDEENPDTTVDEENPYTTVDEENLDSDDEENPDVIVEEILRVNKVRKSGTEAELSQLLGETSKETLRELINKDPLVCGICNKSFTKISNKQRHVRRVHNIKKETGTSLRCIECNVDFSNLCMLRDHLTEKHNLDMTLEFLRFPSMEAFKKWKCEIERKELCSFTLRHGARRGSQGPRYFYACHRSGKYTPKVRGSRQRMMKTQGSCKMGIMCTSAMNVQVNRADVSVSYCPHHYGHGKETTLIQLTAEEQNAISESVSKGIPYESLLDEIRDSQSTKDHFQLHLLKKKDYRSINNSYNCEDFNTGMSDGESIDHWVTLCCQMENSPILYYRKEEKGGEEEFFLVIMTEFQKHILLSSDKHVLCVDSLYRKKGGRFYLTVLFIMDENNLAFPVAFCITNKVDKNVISVFFQSILESTGPLECTFFMSDSEPLYYEAWKEVMNDNSKWLWSMWYVDSRFRIQLRVFRGNVTKRADAYKTMRMLLECQNQTVFHCMLENFIESLRNDPDSKDLSNVVKNHYAPNAEIWAHCYRKEINLSTNIHLEIMHRTFRYCCREGRKTRLDKFIFVIMKLVRDKMLDRLINMMDDERIELAIETINMCHTLGLEILPEQIIALSEKTWLIRAISEEEENYYVMRENSECPEHCNLKCSECDICVHMYVCSCVHNLINANLCQHIHAVVWHLLTPHFTPPSSPVPLLDDIMEKQDHSSEFFQKLLKKTHEVYKQIQANKCNLNKVALNSLMKRMNECVEICSGKVLDITPPAVASPIPVTSSLQPSQPPQITTNPGGYVFINSVPTKPVNNQPIVLSNTIPNVLNSNSVQQGMGGYFILLPNSANTNLNNSNTKTT